METAVLRVRESRGEGPTLTQAPGATRERSTPPRPVESHAEETAAERGAPRFTWLGAFGVLIATGVVVLVLALVGGSSSKPTSAGSSPTAQRSGAAHPAQAAPSHRSGTPGPFTASQSPLSAPPLTSLSASTTTTAPVPAPANGDPVVTALDPATGSPGERIVVVGAGFLSPSGQIVAAFDGQATQTSCPSSTTCTVTVPPRSGGPAAQVTITTSTGTSNAVPFVYDPS